MRSGLPVPSAPSARALRYPQKSQGQVFPCHIYYVKKQIGSVAVEFCNTKLHGTLGSCTIIDEKTKKCYEEVLEQAITDIQYGAIAINTMPPFVFLNPCLTWGGNEEGQDLVSGRGHFGNLLCFENIEKSIIHAAFMSPGHMMNTNKGVMANLAKGMARYATEPGWMNLTKMTTTVLLGKYKGKDF